MKTWLISRSSWRTTRVSGRWRGRTAKSRRWRGAWVSIRHPLPGVGHFRRWHGQHTRHPCTQIGSRAPAAASAHEELHRRHAEERVFSGPRWETCGLWRVGVGVCVSVASGLDASAEALRGLCARLSRPAELGTGGSLPCSGATPVPSGWARSGVRGSRLRRSVAVVAQDLHAVARRKTPRCACARAGARVGASALECSGVLATPLGAAASHAHAGTGRCGLRAQPLRLRRRHGGRGRPRPRALRRVRPRGLYRVAETPVDSARCGAHPTASPLQGGRT